jgi:hypothetical protein
LLLAVLLIPPIRKVFTVPAQWCTEHIYSLFLNLF